MDIKILSIECQNCKRLTFNGGSCQGRGISVIPCLIYLPINEDKSNSNKE